jgi:hypothetical protein
VLYPCVCWTIPSRAFKLFAGQHVPFDCLVFLRASYFARHITNIKGEEIMNEMPVTPIEEPKKSNTPIIIGVVVVVLLCCCCFTAIGVWWLWNNGDSLMNTSSLMQQLI